MLLKSLGGWAENKTDLIPLALHVGTLEQQGVCKTG